MNGPSPDSEMTVRHGYFALIAIASLVLFRIPLVALAHLAVKDERYSYIAFVPFISASLIFLERSTIFRESPRSKPLGSALVSMGIGLFWILRTHGSAPAQTGGLPLFATALILVWTGGFVFCYGTAASKSAVFPLLFLFLVVPPPPGVLEKLVFWLQKGSAEVSYIFFRLAGVPVLRQGFVFSLPGLDIEVAHQCSGIRSSISLFIAGILAGHMILHSTWRKLCLSLLTIPIVIAKNALRIVVLSLLGAYVDRDILFGRIHKTSGLLFSPLALLVLGWLLLVLYRSEKKSAVSG
jgi:exosortase